MQVMKNASNEDTQEMTTSKLVRGTGTSTNLCEKVFDLFVLFLSRGDRLELFQSEEILGFLVQELNFGKVPFSRRRKSIGFGKLLALPFCSHVEKVNNKGKVRNK